MDQQGGSGHEVARVEREQLDRLSRELAELKVDLTEQFNDFRAAVARVAILAWLGGVATLFALLRLF